MAKTDAQKAADSYMEEAITKVIEAYGVLEEGLTMLDFITVIEGMAYDVDGDVNREGFGIVMRYGSARTTVAMGLLEKGKELLQFGEIVQKDDDD